jgi:hypothetical protein
MLQTTSLQPVAAIALQTTSLQPVAAITLQTTLTRQPFERPASEHQINSTGSNIEHRIKPNQSLDIGLLPNQIKAF